MQEAVAVMDSLCKIFRKKLIGWWRNRRLMAMKEEDHG
jgi:hypothetical protein